MSHIFPATEEEFAPLYRIVKNLVDTAKRGKVPDPETLTHLRVYVAVLRERYNDQLHENERQRREFDLRARVRMRQDRTFTLVGEEPPIYYCATCYAETGFFIPPAKQPDTYGLLCARCKTRAYPLGYERQLEE